MSDGGGDEFMWEAEMDAFAAGRRRDARLLTAWLFWLIRRLPEADRAGVVGALRKGQLPLDFEARAAVPDAALDREARAAVPDAVIDREARSAAVPGAAIDPVVPPEQGASSLPRPQSPAIRLTDMNPTAPADPGSAPSPLLSAVLAGQLDRTLVDFDWAPPEDLPPSAGVTRRYHGKVRDCFVLADGRRVLVTTDRISAFDRVLGTIPFKGQVLNQLAAHWFRLSAHLAPNHLLATPDPNVAVARECAPIPVELVMRAYLTGVTSTSIWHAYSQGAREFCGHHLPDGLRKNEPLPVPLLTPSTKAAVGHDESVSADELLRRGLLDGPTLERLGALCRVLFAFGQTQARARGLILVDTKYEVGRATAQDGREELLFIDEIHTPDSSRYWYAEDYEARLSAGEEPRSLDKEYVRRYLHGVGYRGDGPPPLLPDEVRIEAARRYIEAYERLTGGRFQPDVREPGARIHDNLKEYLR